MLKLRKTVLIALITLSLVQLPAVKADADQTGKKSDVVVESRKMDKRANILKNYLEKQGSPLQYNAQDFIEAADTYNLDWKLVPAIAGVESTFGQFTPGGYNGWGWGVYGNQALYFKSWREGIFTVSKGLKENYIDKGLDTPAEMNRVYAASPAWGAKVSYFLNDMEKFEKGTTFAETGESPVKYNSAEAKTAASSAKLTLKQP